MLGARGDPPKGPTCRATQMKEVPLWTLSGNPDILLIFFFFVSGYINLAVNENEYFTELQLKEEIL